MSASDLAIDARDLTVGVYMYEEDGELNIECNFCSMNDFKFFQGTPDVLPPSDWASKAAIHLSRDHREGLEFNKKKHYPNP